MAGRCSLFYRMCEFRAMGTDFERAAARGAVAWRRALPWRIEYASQRGEGIASWRDVSLLRGARNVRQRIKLPLNAPRRVAMRAERRSLIDQMCCSMRQMGDAFRARRLRCGMAGRRSLASRVQERAAKGGFSSKELRRAADGRGRENLKDFARRQGFRRKRFGRRLALSPRAKKRRCDQPAATRCASERRL